MKPFNKLAQLALVLAALAPGCEQSPEPLAKSQPEIGQRILYIGLIPEQNIFRQLDRYDPIASYLSSNLGVQIKLKVLDHYGSIVENFRSLNLDGAFFGSFTYLLAHRRLGVEVLVRPVGLDGTSKYHGLLIARKDAEIRGPSEMEGRIFAFVHEATTAGYLFPLAYFRANGIREYGTYFSETYFAGTHEDVITDVLDRRADVGAIKNTVYDRLAGSRKGISEELVILARSPDVPENALAVRSDLDPSLKEAIKNALLSMHRDPAGAAALKEFGESHFIETTDEDYEPALRYATEVGIDLATYGDLDK